jgi:hypothetical protein
MKNILALAAIVAAFGFAGSMDLQDAQGQQDRYCEYVADGTWPDYNPEINCSKQ